MTPRAIIDGHLFGLPTKVTAGFDYYNSTLDAKRSQALTDPPYHTYDLNQQSVAALLATDVVGCALDRYFVRCALAADQAVGARRV